MTVAPFDPLAALRALTEAGVDFVVVGGIAGRLHGSVTVTNDLDICYHRSSENLERLSTVLIAAGARLRGVDEDLPFTPDPATLAAGDAFTFVTRFGNLDIFGSPVGVAGFASLSAGAVSYDLDGTTVKVASLDDLISMKLAAGRPKDLIEAEVLGALRDEIDGRAR